MEEEGCNVSQCGTNSCQHFHSFEETFGNRWGGGRRACLSGSPPEWVRVRGGGVCVCVSRGVPEWVAAPVVVHPERDVLQPVGQVRAVFEG